MTGDAHELPVRAPDTVPATVMGTRGRQGARCCSTVRLRLGQLLLMVRCRAGGSLVVHEYRQSCWALRYVDMHGDVPRWCASSRRNGGAVATRCQANFSGVRGQAEVCWRRRRLQSRGEGGLDYIDRGLQRGLKGTRGGCGCGSWVFALPLGAESETPHMAACRTVAISVPSCTPVQLRLCLGTVFIYISHTPFGRHGGHSVRDVCAPGDDVPHPRVQDPPHSALPRTS